MGWRCSRCVGREGQVPKFSSRVTLSGQDNGVGQDNSDLFGSELHSAPGITKLSHGKERGTGKHWDNVYASGGKR
jgi:hypothetical protein